MAWKLAQSPRVEVIYCAPGNGGTARENKCQNIDLQEIADLVAFAKANDVALTIVGPEEPLTRGIVDTFKAAGLQIFGPSQKGAMLEGSKAFAKDFMKRYGVKTAAYAVFTDNAQALSYLRKQKFPLVIKADGLAAGKGVIVCATLEEGEAALQKLQTMSKTIIIEEFLEGVEASILSITDGTTIIPFIAAKDHKQIFDGNRGANTGGMGVVCPNPYVDEQVWQAFTEQIMAPTLAGIKKEKMDFVGIIFFGLMVTKQGVYLLEYNVRMGDPETQGVLFLLESDFLELLEQALAKRLQKVTLQWENQAACVVVGTAAGYPGSYEKNQVIAVGELRTSKLFMAGAKIEDGQLLTNGGRVLAVVAKAPTLAVARERCYAALRQVHFNNMYYRKDIGIAK